MKPLYRFRLDENTGKIHVHEITDYEEGRWSGYTRNDLYWKYKDKGVMKYCYTNKLDRFVSGQVYSFDSSLDHAYEIIHKELLSKRDKAYKEYCKYLDLVEKLEGHNDKIRS